ncbi:MAG: NAD(+)/NADH kinase, partial [Bacteroidales bacterium]|nr:NAD(+)/NADH kinase [Bacteroidales bacterium]
MQVAVYGRNFHDSCRENVAALFTRLESLKADVLLYRPFYDYLKNTFRLQPRVQGLFDGHRDLPEGIDFLFSVGGDGTFLETLSIVREKDIPVVGLNTGRLGFLAYISQENLETSLDSIFNGRYDIEERTLLEVTSNGNSVPDLNLALNEVRVYKNFASLITIHVHVDSEFLCSYWADGLILSTPTGSTAYNLSVGGPIVVPEADVMVLSPIAPRNLTNRPLVLPGKAKLRFTVETREPMCQLALDSRSGEIPVT